MLLAATSLLIATCGCCPSFEPKAPFTNRSVESGWGEPWNGLSILATTDADTVDVGAEIRFETFFRFDAFLSDGRVRAMGASEDLEGWTLALREHGRDVVYERRAYDEGMPSLYGPEDHVELRSGSVHVGKTDYFLLGSRGEQVPPGDYDVQVVYSNQGAKDRFLWNDEQRLDRVPYEPGTVWAGEIRTATFPLHVREPAASLTTGNVPTRIVIELIRNTWMWHWDPNSFHEIAVATRPGYHIGTQHTLRWPEGLPIPQQYAGPDGRVRTPEWISKGQGGFPFRTGGKSAVGGREFIQWVADGARPRLHWDLVVFETSVAPGHGWMPEGGDYRVLYECAIEQDWPESP
jgi:hypothetical protein